MTNYQMAGQLVPCALRAANAAAGAPIGDKTLIQMAGAVSTAAAIHGIDRKREITRAAVKIAPEFKQISKDFFQVMQETPAIAKAAYSREYEEIAEFVLQNHDLSRKERLKLYCELHETKTAEAVKVLKKICTGIILISIAAGAAVYFLNPTVHEEVNSAFDRIRKTIAKITKHVKQLFKMIKFVTSPVIKMMEKL